MRVLDLGRMPYRACAELQAELLERISAGEDDNTLIFVEHDPVLTLGAGFHQENLLHSQAEYAQRGITIEPSNRGGDVTYHGPGQLVIYPIFRLDVVARDLHRWMRSLEDTMIRTCRSFGLNATDRPRSRPPAPGPSLTGCWIEDRKVAAIGVKVRRWTSMHGIALNCDLELGVYDLFVPCGLRDFGVTSLSLELGRQVSIEDAKPAVLDAFQAVFPSA